MNDKILEEYFKSLEGMTKEELNAEANKRVIAIMESSPKGFVKIANNDKTMIKIKELLKTL